MTFMDEEQAIVIRKAGKGWRVCREDLPVNIEFDPDIKVTGSASRLADELTRIAKLVSRNNLEVQDEVFRQWMNCKLDDRGALTHESRALIMAQFIGSTHEDVARDALRMHSLQIMEDACEDR